MSASAFFGTARLFSYASPLARIVLLASVSIRLGMAVTLVSGSCGDVTANAGFSGLTGQPSWIWGDGTTSLNWFPATHTYKQNGTYTVTVTAPTASGSVSESGSVVINSAADAGCLMTVTASPEVIALRDGRTSAQIVVKLSDSAGNALPLSDRTVTFSSSAADQLVKLDSSGRVSSSGFGRADVTVAVSGVTRTATVHVYAGHLRIEPAILYLSIGGKTSGKFTMDAANADGTPADLSKYPINWTLHAAPDVAVSSADGTVTALRAPLTWAERPYMTATAGSFDVPYTGVIQISPQPFDPDLGVWRNGNIALYAPKQAGSWDYAGIIQQFNIPGVLGMAYDLEYAATGVAPFYGGTQYLAVQAGLGRPDPDPTLPCGLSGNPVLLGTNLTKAMDNSCFIIAEATVNPQWGVYFHEMGHNFTFGSQRFGVFAGSGPSNANFTYGEGLATLLTMYVSRAFAANPAKYGLSATAAQTIVSVASSQFGPGAELDGYLRGGPIYSSMNPNILDDMLGSLMNQYGIDWVPRFYAVFLPQTVAYPFAISSETQQASFFVAAVSAAIGVDLRANFRTWGFPIDDSYYSSVFLEVSALARRGGAPAQTSSALLINSSSTLPGVVGRSYSQVLAAVGGIPPYTWSAASAALPPGLSVSTAGAIAGVPTAAGTYTFTVQVVDSASAIATRTFTLSIFAAGALVRSGVLSHFAAGGGWDTTFTLVNSSSAAANTRVVFHGEDGTELSLPLTVAQESASQSLTGSAVELVLLPNSTVVISTATQASSTVVGWADVLSSSNLAGFAIFRSTPQTGSPSEGTVPLQGQSTSAITLPYDNTAGFVMGVAIANLSTATVNVTATIWDESGNRLGTQQMAVAGNGHTSFVLPTQIPLTTGQRGTVQFQSAVSGGIAGIGLRFSPYGTFTSVPVF